MIWWCKDSYTITHQQKSFGIICMSADLEPFLLKDQNTEIIEIVLTLSGIFSRFGWCSYFVLFSFLPEDLLIQLARRFSLALQGSVLLHRIPFSYWQSTQLKLGCNNSRLHWTLCCNLQFFEIHWQCTRILAFFRGNFTSSKESN